MFEGCQPFLLIALSAFTPSRATLHQLAEKGLHLVLYCVFALLLWHTLPSRAQKVRSVLLAGAVLGTVSEFLQAFFPGRDPLLTDVLLNIMGTGIGISLSLFIYWLNRSKTEPTRSIGN